MALLVTAVAKAVFVSSWRKAELGDNHCRIYSAVGFAARLDGKRKGVYSFDGEPIAFAVGSYISNSSWMRLLSLAVFGVPSEEVWKNPMVYKGLPFFELVYMEDQGSIGPKTSKKLVADFLAHKETIRQKVRTVIEDDFDNECNLADYKFSDYGFGLEGFICVYNKWCEVFARASDEGFVCFG